MSDEITSSTVMKVASAMRRENVEKLAYVCMGLGDTAMDQLINDNPKVDKFKYEVFMKWINRSGAKMGDLKKLIIQAIKEKLDVEPEVRGLLGIT